MKKTTIICPLCDKELEALENNEEITFRCEKCDLNGIFLKQKK